MKVSSYTEMIRAREVSLTRVMISLDMGARIRLTIWQKRHVAEDLCLGHAQHLSCLLLAHRDALDAAR